MPKVIVATLPTQRGYIVEASIVTTGFGRDRTAGEKWFNKSIWYNWYKVQIKDSQNNVWTCKKRYREFEALHSEVVSIFLAFVFVFLLRFSLHYMSNEKK